MAKKSKTAAAVISPLLITIVGFGPTGGWAASGDELNALSASGLVEIGPVNAADATQVAVRATESGVKAATVPPAAPAAAAAPKPSFNVVMSVPVPESNRGGNKGKSIYPFEGMAVGASFFIPATAETPDPAKSLASTATSATRRYDEVVTENGVAVQETVKVKGKEVTREKKRHTRVFVMRPIADGAPWGSPGVPGAGVFRTI